MSSSDAVGAEAEANPFLSGSMPGPSDGNKLPKSISFDQSIDARVSYTIRNVIHIH